MFAKLRIAEGGFLGLRVHLCPCIAAALVVVHIEEGGAVAAWNRILEADGARIILVGDVILEVNGQDGSAHMFVALSSAATVSLTFTRYFSLWHAELGVTTRASCFPRLLDSQALARLPAGALRGAAIRPLPLPLPGRGPPAVAPLRAL